MKSNDGKKTARIISLEPDGEFYYQLGMKAFQKGDLWRSQKYLERAVHFSPEETEYLCQLAAILAELEQFDSSNECLKRVVYELDASIAECHFFIANNSAYLGRINEALSEIKRYIRKDTEGIFIREARELYESLIHEAGGMPEDAEHITEHERGREALEQGAFKEARAAFESVIEADPEFWPAHNNLAVADFAAGETARAFDRLNLVLGQDAGNIHALCNRVVFYDQLGQHSRARDLLGELRSLYPLYGEQQRKLGATYFFMGDYDYAYLWLKKAEADESYWGETFYYWLSISAYKIGKTREAAIQWEKALELSHQPFSLYEHGKIQEMILEETAEKNPLVRTLVADQLKRGTAASRLLSIFLLRSFGDDEADRLLADAASSPQSGDFSGAARLIYETEKGNVPGTALAVIDILEMVRGEGSPLIKSFDLYQWWYQLYKEKLFAKGPETEREWAAALDYVKGRQDGEAADLGDICERYGSRMSETRSAAEKVEKICMSAKSSAQEPLLLI